MKTTLKLLILTTFITACSSNVTTSPKCTESYIVNKGDTCASIETKFGLTPSQFLKLNPGIHNCAKLTKGAKVCVRPK